MSRERIISTLIIVALFLCIALQVKGQSDVSSRNILAFRDVTYKKSSDGKALNLDIFLPDSTINKNFPVVVIIHGGGWAEGDKILETIYYMRRFRQKLIENDYAVVSINYSLVGNDVHFPTPIRDCKDAIKWLKQHADRYHFDTTNFGLWGGSAGGHLALLAAYSTDVQFIGEPALAQYSARVNYVVDNFGPTDLASLLRIDMSKFFIFFMKIFFKKMYVIREKLIFYITGYNLKTDKEKVRNALNKYSPLEYVSPTTVPTIIFHGTKDNVVPINQSYKLRDKLNQLGVENSFITVENGDHGFNNIDTVEIDKAVGETVEFIKIHKK